MADTSAQDKNLPASQRKLDKARAEGQVARSVHLGHFAAIAGGSALLVAAAPLVAAGLRDALAASLRFDRRQ
ncbi:MAG: EscU/YscU/HrcU family type III secretion system export apparatus switch protein, partial [Caldimonas sp.]